MPANECLPYKEPGQAFTFKATAAVTGKRFVAVSGNRTGGPGLSTDLANVYQCAHAGAGAAAVGVSKYDTANGALGGAHTGGIVPVTTGEAIAAGDRIAAGANGVAMKWAHAAEPAADPVCLGVAMNGAANGADCEILLSL